MSLLDAMNNTGKLKRPAEEQEAPAAKSRKTATKSSASNLAGFCSLSKKEFGDKIKDALRLEKYAVSQTVISMSMDATFFRSFFGGQGIKIVPEAYDDDTPVVVANLSNSQAGAVFGVSKIKNGNRMETIHLLRMVVVLYPSEKRADAWVSA